MNRLIEIPDNDLFVFDLRYRTTGNFTGKKLSVPRHPTLQPDAVHALVLAAQKMNSDGYRMVIWDAYRPQAAQNVLLAHESNRNYVASDSNHCKGLAVDVSLQEIGGQLLEMPTDYDDFRQMAHADYDGGDISDVARRNRDYLISQMESVGFSVNPYEWWHFDKLG